MPNIRYFFAARSISTPSDNKGRTMMEMLGVLVVIAMLTFGAIYGITLIFSKHRANVILYDARMAYANYKTNESAIPDWTEVNFTTDCGKEVMVQTDEDDDLYVKVNAIEKKVCTQLLHTASNGDVAFYTEENEPMLSCENDLNNVIFAFDGLTAMGENCTTAASCPNAGDYCHATEGICKSCPVGYGVNARKNGCLIVCDDSIETSCVEGADSWCCPNTQLCGTKDNPCVDSDGWCSYTLRQQVNVSAANCSYTIQTQQNVAESDCSYTIQTQQNVSHSDCSYSIVIGANGEASSMTAIQGCAAGQYCYVAYTDDTCSSTAPADQTGTIYGACLHRSIANKGCPVTSVGSTMVQQKGCTAGQYCYVAYQDDTCQTTAPADQTGTIYGTCLHRSIANKGCPVTSVGSTMVQRQGCPDGQYCYVAYQDDTCQTTAPADQMGTIYGACLHRSIANKGCPVTSVGSTLLPIQECPEAEYCYLKWSDDSCTNAAADIMGTIYGACLHRRSGNAVCPIR